MQQKNRQSIVTRITLLMTSAIILTVILIMSTVTISEMSDNDAAIINLSGSLRMDSYKMATELLKAEQSKEFDQAVFLAQAFSWKLKNPLFLNLQSLFDTQDSIGRYDQILTRWQEQISPVIHETMEDPSKVHLAVALLEESVAEINKLVYSYQQNAEQKVYALRLIGLATLFLTVLIIMVAVYYIQVSVKTPLEKLTEGAEKLSSGDLSVRIPIGQNDELGLLASTMNHSAKVISNMHQDLERRVQVKTIALKKTNERLNLLFSIARNLNNSTTSSVDYSLIIIELSRVSGLKKLDLCLLSGTESDTYHHIGSAENQAQPMVCLRGDCKQCLLSERSLEDQKQYKQIKYALVKDEKKYGLLICTLEENQRIQSWQHQLLTSVADQFATGLYLAEKSNQVNRLALLQERTIIARELHDSLAQALSYLKIQVSILQSSLKNDRHAPIIDQTVNELREGLSDGYTQLRQLLTTFRLQISGTNFKSALEDAIKSVNEKSNMDVLLNYNIGYLPLNPSEQIHLLQICKEALQNACHHSNGTQVDIELVFVDESKLLLTVQDDGIGIPEASEKVNHFGLSIMNERSRSLGGDISIQRVEKQGTLVTFEFVPEFVKKGVKKGVKTG